MDSNQQDKNKIDANQQVRDIKTVALRLSTAEYDRLSHYKKKGESWEAYLLALVYGLDKEINTP